MHQFGINIDRLDKFIAAPREMKKSWGMSAIIADVPEYRLEKLEVRKGKKLRYVPRKEFDGVVFVEEGRIVAGKLKVGAKESFGVGAGNSAEIHADSPSILYIFSGPKESRKWKRPKSWKTTDFRDKYWGTIETIVSRNFAAKRIFVRKNKSASLEFHCRKLENYYIHSGKLLLRLRAGRGEDRFFELTEGRTALTPPGLMHQRGGIEDTVIIEISTQDEDSDSFLVEDGAKVAMPRLFNYVK